jgi:hypothetical protein
MRSRRTFALASVTLLASVTFAWAGLRSVYLPDAALRTITGGDEEHECNRSNTACNNCGIYEANGHYFKCTSNNAYNECFQANQASSCGECTDMTADCGQFLLCAQTGGCVGCEDNGDICAGCNAVENADACPTP